MVGMDEGSGGGDGLQEEMSVAVDNVETISPHVVFADECPGEFRAKFESEVVCGNIVGVDVGVGRCEKWGRF